MNILIPTWVWYQVGGDWTYINNVRNLYEQHGHKVIPFAMKSEKNVGTEEFEKYFVDFIDYKVLNKERNIVNAVRAVKKTIYSSEAKQKLNALLADYPVDVAHLQNIHHYLTPSILPVLKSRKIPILWTLHDYTILCPENSFVSNGQICEKCKGGYFINCAINKCKKGSFLASALAGVENYVHRYMGLLKHVDYYLCPSDFIRRKFIEFGFDEKKMVLINNCLDMSSMPQPVLNDNETREDYILYIGRLEKTKGIITLIEAMKELPLKLKILGGGSLYEEINNMIMQKGLTNIELLGHVNRDEVYKIITGSSFMVCPSEWYENYPYSIVETLYLGKPIIGSDIGGIPELVIDNYTGLLFKPFDRADLREKIQTLHNNKVMQNSFSANARAMAEHQFSFSTHYQNLKNVYARVGKQL